MIDYQWPSSLNPPGNFFHDKGRNKKNADTSKKIENFFGEKFGVSAILMPSARAAISLILRAEGILRTQNVFAPKYSSHCVWDCVTRYATPQTTFNEKIDAALLVHKFARAEKLKKSKPKIIIEDSVDSIIENSSYLFQNKGNYEILSLPKIMGTYSGGIILVRKKNIAEKLRSVRKNDLELNIQQSYLKYLAAKGKQAKENKFYDWQYLEWNNFGIDSNGLNNILTNLENYSLNKKIIERRKDKIFSDKTVRPFLTHTDGRLGPVIAIACKHFNKIPEALPIRFLNSSGFSDAPVFEQACLIPVHFGVNEKEFGHFFKQVKKYI